MEASNNLVGKWSLIWDGSDHLPGIDKLKGCPLALHLTGNSDVEYIKIEKQKAFNSEAVLISYVTNKIGSIALSYQLGSLNFMHEDGISNGFELGVIQNCNKEFTELTIARFGPLAGQCSKEIYILNKEDDEIKLKIEIATGEGAHFNMIKYFRRFDQYHLSREIVLNKVAYVQGWKSYDFWPSTVLSNCKVLMVKALKIELGSFECSVKPKIMGTAWTRPNFHDNYELDISLINRNYGYTSEPDQGVFFIIQVSLEGVTWYIAHRYREFDWLREFIMHQDAFNADFQKENAKFPSKIVGLSMRLYYQTMVDRRATQLEDFLAYFVSNARFCRQNSVDALCSFLAIPEHIRSIHIPSSSEKKKAAAAAEEEQKLFTEAVLARRSEEEKNPQFSLAAVKAATTSDITDVHGEAAIEATSGIVVSSNNNNNINNNSSTSSSNYNDKDTDHKGSMNSYNGVISVSSGSSNSNIAIAPSSGMPSQEHLINHPYSTTEIDNPSKETNSSTLVGHDTKDRIIQEKEKLLNNSNSSAANQIEGSNIIRKEQQKATTVGITTISSNTAVAPIDLKDTSISSNEKDSSSSSATGTTSSSSGNTPPVNGADSDNNGASSSGETVYKNLFVKLRRGIKVIKHGRHGAPKQRVLFCDADFTKVFWTSAVAGTGAGGLDMSKYILLSDIVSVRKGTDIDIESSSPNHLLMLDIAARSASLPQDKDNNTPSNNSITNITSETVNRDTSTIEGSEGTARGGGEGASTTPTAAVTVATTENFSSINEHHYNNQSHVFKRKSNTSSSLLRRVSRGASTSGAGVVHHGTAILRRHCTQKELQLCFSLFLPDRTFDIQCLSAEDYNFLLNGFLAVCSRNNKK